ncbi:diadenosine tetraphosphate hydrolase [Alsobacter soli]|uniref:Diadenosine tetraphosphate hydrolase n=1 Tax=Alsobacter soli TaxID=2109933 RepID=A0A2T1HXJ1_9HYPH|nr:HIT family protein [Alsobacter soli]PSC06209.1 diadenosine tetraphosphate hydrolase [Alsobacter soli]
MTTFDQAESGFSLHPQLAADTAVVGDLLLSRVLLMKDARFPWLILVPRRAEIREIIHLSDGDQARLHREVAEASRAIKGLFRPDKLNIGAIGNMVPQLHVHVVGRTQADAAWPRPVWGSGPAEAYSDVALAERVARIAAALGRIAPAGARAI